MKKLLSIAVVLTAAVAAGVWLAVFLSLPGHPATTRFSVQAGESADKIAADLADTGFIRSRAIFLFVLKQSGQSTKLQPGTYDLAGVKSYDDIVARLVAGGVPANEFVLLIKEGWNLRDIRDQLKKDGYARADELFGVTGIPASLTEEGNRTAAGLVAEFPFLKSKPDDVSLEGFLFPDTYRIYRDASPADLVRKLLDNFGRKTEPLATEVATFGHSWFEVVTMASVIEDEVRGEEDRRRVSDIFWRRLAAGIPLQADSTVNYVTGKSAAAVSLEDTEADSRYNTYKYAGLPVGPICNPGLSAIRAALEPDPNPYWFFLTDENGVVHYARNLQEHAANKAKYLK